MSLKQFKGPKSLEEIRLQCEAQDLILHHKRHDEFLSDFVVVVSPKAPQAAVYYSTVNGWFFGTTDTGVPFDSRKPLDDEPWFAVLLDFFLVPLDQPPAEGVPAADSAEALNLGELLFESTPSIDTGEA